MVRTAPIVAAVWIISAVIWFVRGMWLTGALFVFAGIAYAVMPLIRARRRRIDNPPSGAVFSNSETEDLEPMPTRDFLQDP
jgi:membrane protein implicated in regulation of membrane protease activity